jgi:DNA/RNA-binding domain of Phe-tRNA-synthetase-like protein
VLVDAQGPFGNPSSDSARTMIRPTTRRALVTVYAPAAYSPARLALVLDATEETLKRFGGGHTVDRRMLPDAP